MNTSQKIAIFVASVLLAILLVLHGPWTGYYIADPSVWREDPSVFEWYSNSTLIQWFGYIGNVAIIATLITGLAGFWCYLFRSPKSGEA